MKKKRKEKFKKVRFLDALTASGLRMLRTKQEIPESLLESVTGVDISDFAKDIFKTNLHLNNLEETDNIHFHLADTNQFMQALPPYKRYDVIDIDPYGTMVPFLDAALHAGARESLFCVTSTDTRVLCGSDRHKCFYMYGAVRDGDDHIEETGLRVALATLQRCANIQNKSVEPLLCVQSDFYIRLFVRVRTSRQKCWGSMASTGLQFYCKDCGNQHIEVFGEFSKKHPKQARPKKFELQSGKCENCGGNFSMTGPIYTDKLYDPEFVQQMLDVLDYLENPDLKGTEREVSIIIILNFF